MFFLSLALKQSGDIWGQVIKGCLMFFFSLALKQSGDIWGQVIKGCLIKPDIAKPATYIDHKAGHLHIDGITMMDQKYLY